MPTLSLNAIQQRIAQQDSELQTLRRELEARQSRLQALMKHKQDLQNRLQHIETEMAAIAAGTKRPAASSSKPATKSVTAKRSVPRRGQPSLASLIVAILQDAGRVLTVQQITQAVKQRGFPTKSKALHKLVGKNVYALATKGNLRRSKGHPAAFAVSTGIGKSAPASTAKPAKAAGAAPTTASHKPAINGAAKPASGPNAAAQTPLRELLEQILHKSAKPMTGSELAAAALKAGYKTKSKRLVDNVWTALGNMKNVENIKGQGYRLKRSN